MFTAIVKSSDNFLTIRPPEFSKLIRNEKHQKLRYSEVVLFYLVLFTQNTGQPNNMRRLTRNIAECFIIMLAIIVCLQLGFYIYTNSFSWSFITSSSRLPYKGLRSEQELANTTIERAIELTRRVVAAISTTTKTTKVTPHSLFNAVSNWKPFKPKTTLITNRTCAHYFTVLILVSSAPANLQRRNCIRKTWAFDRAFKPRWTTVFLVAQSRIKNVSKSLLKEDELYGDLVRADYYDHYWNQTLKIQMGFEWAIKYCKFAFLLKVDDDVFVNSKKLYSFLSDLSTPKSKLYMGIHRKNALVQRRGKWKVAKEEYSDNTYPDFCPGFGYVLSHDVSVTFADAFALVPYYRMDDVYVGLLAHKTGIKITHNAGFEMSSPKQCIPNEGTLVRHGFFKQNGTREECFIEIFYRATNVLN